MAAMACPGCEFTSDAPGYCENCGERLVVESDPGNPSETRSDNA